ncbi:hypothetical protein GC173_14625 [bacterium]|nr:hypothetical protein [bacterium]
MIQVRFLSISPKVWREGPILHARTNMFVILCRLGLRWTSFRADTQRRVFEVTRHNLWFFPSTRTISFDHVREILYRYEDPFSFMQWIDHARDSVDCYTIGLRLYDESELQLFSWTGEGAFANESLYHDLFYWQEFLFDFEGTQKKESLGFYELLTAMIRPRGRLMRE